jgi:hypothetical protein
MLKSIDVLSQLDDSSGQARLEEHHLVLLRLMVSSLQIL